MLTTWIIRSLVLFTGLVLVLHNGDARMFGAYLVGLALGVILFGIRR